MRRTFLKGILAAGVAAVTFTAVSVQAGPLMDRIESGETIRLGFANEVPWAYPGENNKPLGFVNAYAIGVLKQMGYDNIEPVVTEWGGLIPGLKAIRFDVITGGMYILESRCENVAFSEPMGRFGDAFIVAKGNPKGIENYKDIKDKGALFVTGAGYNTVEAAKKEGVPEANILTVPGPTEILAAVKAGRADAGGVTYFTALNLAKESADEVEVTDPAALPDWTLNWVGIAFRDADQDFLDKFNAAQKEYLGSADMLGTVAEYGYTESQLPGDVTTEWVCSNR
ncbi:ectoine/hydroxyectoine ABC transporter substrate-binding protein EhuB [Stappia sp. GBMRC 2046]|uniref:Ectoine/hydroxyectoine ABC transporter substrate-binding protein EhuB n=1 Tax=Stappia sediminis TaxID=2692190 RepID=A0A7X3LUZ8_9HYPH|nr:ectoine/hydroxyectoine ABC transporter substrate-binding protein EhuB [Stappia sediminis]MXN65538.1 ectoine/hydroxyectoine ABC transporter substrate-binding protein EhuB [Stappia sediminis]